MKNILISFTRSGRAWTMTICEVLNELLPEGLPFKHSHDNGADRKFHEYTPDKSKWAKHRIVLVARDPRDVVVSYWHILHYRSRRPPASKMNLWEWTKFEHGLPFVVRFLNDWARAIKRDVVERANVVQYETLRRDHAFGIRCLAHGLGVAQEALTPEIVAETVRRTTFAQIRKKFAHSNTGPDERAYATRRGEVGAWRDYYTPEQEAWITGYVNDLLDREFWPDYVDGP